MNMEQKNSKLKLVLKEGPTKCMDRCRDDPCKKGTKMLGSYDPVDKQL